MALIASRARRLCYSEHNGDGDYTLGPNYNFPSVEQMDGRQKNQFWKRHRRSSLTTTTKSGLPGPNNPFGGPNAAAAVLRDVDKRKESERKESGRFVFEGEQRLTCSAQQQQLCPPFKWGEQKDGRVVIIAAEYLHAEPDLALLSRSLGR